MRDPSEINWLLLAISLFLLFGPAIFFGKKKRKDDDDKKGGSK